MKNGKYIALLLALVMMMSCLSIPVLAEYQAESVVIAADDDSFNVAPWSNSQGEVSNYLQNIIWTHLATRPFTGAMIGVVPDLVAQVAVAAHHGFGFQVAPVAVPSFH